MDYDLVDNEGKPSTIGVPPHIIYSAGMVLNWMRENKVNGLAGLRLNAMSVGDLADAIVRAKLHEKAADLSAHAVVDFLEDRATILIQPGTAQGAFSIRFVRDDPKDDPK